MDTVFWGNFDTLCEKAEGNPSAISSVPNVDSVRLRLGATDRQILFVRDSVMVNCSAQLAQLSKEYNSLSVVLVYDEIDMAKVWGWLAAFPNIAHVMPVNSGNSYHRVQELMANRTSVFLPKDLTGGQSVLLSESGQCDQVYSAVSAFLAERSCFSGFTTIAVTSASELLTNAFYNAKRDSQTGKPVNSDRKVKVQLEGSEKVEMAYGVDAKYFWLIVRDEFGTLDRATFVRAIGRAARERTPLESAGGAGLGMHMLFSWATELNVMVEPGRSTTIACKFLLTPRNRLFEAEPSALHWLSSESGWI
jgi:hypothetical protein